MSARQFTEKQTKAEILAAYNELVARTQTFEGRPSSPAQPVQASTKMDDPTKTITEVRAKILSDLHGAAQAIEALIAQKHELEETIKQKTNELERVHQIKISAQTLEELREKHHQEQSIFEQELARQRQAWEHEQKERQLRLQHENQLQLIKRQQDEAQYRFEREQIWQKEEAGRLAKLQEREDLITQREKALNQAQQEFNELRAKVANTPKELESAVKQAEQLLRSELIKTFEQEKKFLTQQMEHERQLASQENTTLKQTIATQKIEIDQLTKQLTEATRQLNQIAIKVIETGGQKSPAGGSPESSTIIKPTKE